MLLGDGFINHFLSNSLLLPCVAYIRLYGKGHASRTYDLPCWLADRTWGLHHIRQTDRKVLGTAKLTEAKKVCLFGFSLFMGCQQWDDSVHTLVLYAPSHVMVIQLSNLGHTLTWCRNQCLFTGRQCVYICACMCRAGLCTVQHNAHDSFENHASCK